jgi:hypothetical protein
MRQTAVPSGGGEISPPLFLRAKSPAIQEILPSLQPDPKPL